MRSLLRRFAEVVLLGVFLSGFLITLGLMGDFWQSFSEGLARVPVPEGPSKTEEAAANQMERSILAKPINNVSMAVWISNPDSDWQSLVSGLRRQGLTFRIAHGLEDLDVAVILVYPSFSGKAIAPHIYKHLLQKVRSGTVLITQNVESELSQRFGFQKARYSQDESYICLERHLSRCKDNGRRWTSLRFEKPDGDISGFETMGYVGAKHPLAKFGSGDAALIVNPLGKGALYAFGLDVGTTLRQTQGVGLPIKPITESEALTTWIYDQIQTIYLTSGAKHPLSQKSDQGKPELLITHEIRNEGDLLQALRWADLEYRLGVKAIFIIDYAFMKGMTPDLWVSPKSRAQLSEISHLGHVIALGWLKGSPPIEALEGGNGEESIRWSNEDGGRNQPTFPGSQTGILRIGRHVLEQGYGLGVVDIFMTDQELIPETFEKALRRSGFRFLSRSGFATQGLKLPMMLQPSEDEISDQELMLLPSRVRVEHLGQSLKSFSGASMVLFDIPLGPENADEIEIFFEELKESFEVTDLRIHQEKERALIQQKAVLERHKNKYEIRIESPSTLGPMTIRLPAGMQKIYGLPKICPRRLEAEVMGGENWVEVCHFSRSLHAGLGFKLINSSWN